MAGRHYESLVGFYPLKWYSITFLMGLFCSKPHLIMIEMRLPFTLKCRVAWSQIKIIVLICLFFPPFSSPLAMTLIGGDRTLRIKNIFWGLLNNCEPWILLAHSYSGVVLVQASWKWHCFVIHVLHILRVPLIACPSQPLNNNNAGTKNIAK